MKHGPKNQRFDDAPASRRQLSYIPAINSTNVSEYSRDRYGSGSYANREKQATKRRVPIWLRVLLFVMLAVVLGVGGYAFWFTATLDSTLAKEQASDTNVKNVLIPTDINDPFYVLLLGSDSREGGYSPAAAEQEGLQRSDVIVLVRVDVSNRKLTMLSIPRDTPCTLEDGTIAKINEMYNREGAAGSIKAVSELTGVPIAHYAVVGFADLEAIVDLLGGVEVDIDVELTYWDVHSLEQVTLEPGKQTIDGQQAQIFARARHEYAGLEGGTQDSHRQGNVRSLLAAIIDKTLDRPVTEIPGIVLKEAEHVTTDIRSKDLVALAMAYATSSGSVTVYSGTGPVDGDTVDYADGQWLCYRNPEGWAQLMAVVDAGNDPAGIDFSATQIPW